MRGATLVPTRDVNEPADSDPRLVAAVRLGDDRAFEALYERYQRRIHAYVFGMVKDHGRAEDVTQEIFVSALRRMRETEQPIVFKPWLYQIAKNSCIDAFRRSRRAEEVSYDAEEALAPADQSKLVGSGPSPDAAVAAKEDLDHLRGAFGGLSETHHEILVLRELEGLSYQEIGTRMGMSRSAVESTLFRARRRLTEEYDDIVSGARCLRIQGIIATATETPDLGTRDLRRLARHLSHCQVCRREALAAGLDRNLFTRPGVRERIATRVAAILPFPALARFRERGGADTAASAAMPQPGRWSAHLPMLSDQLTSGWGKAAAGAALVVAGVGGAAGVHQVTLPSSSAATPKNTPALVVPARTPAAKPAGTPATTPTARLAGGKPGTAPTPKTSSATSRDRVATTPSRGSIAPAAANRATPAGGGSVPDTSGSNPTSTSTTSKSADTGAGGSKTGSSGGNGTGNSGTPTTPAVVPAATVPAVPAVPPVKDVVDGAVAGTTGAVEGAVAGATGAVDNTVTTVTGGGPVADGVDKVTDGVDKVVGGVGSTVKETVGKVTEGVDKTLGGLTGGLNPGDGG